MNLKRFLLLLAAAGTIGLAACDDPLKVENPNSLVEEDLSDPVVASGLANGALATTANAISELLAVYNTVGDEINWIGSRDGWGQLDDGNVSDANNEFTDDAWQWVTEARWTADKAVESLEAFDAEGTLPDRSDLGRSYLYAALIRVVIADMFDNFVFSDRREPARAVGEDQMVGVYDDAIALLDKALSVAQAESDTELQARVLGLRARAKHARAVWGLLNPKGSQPSNPYVDAGADDAQAVLAQAGDDWRWQLNYAVTWGEGANDFSFQVNGRLELAFESPLPNDLLDGAEDVRIAAAVAEFSDEAANGGTDFAPHTAVSAREMYLIVAESQLAGGDADGAKTTLNTLRGLDNLTLLDSQVSVGELLQHERRANLYIQGRRLTDMYRFGVRAPEWESSSEAFNTPGAFLPIVRREIEANPFVGFGGN